MCWWLAVNGLASKGDRRWQAVAVAAGAVARLSKCVGGRREGTSLLALSCVND